MTSPPNAGTHSPAPAATSASNCSSCAKGSYSLTAASICDLCAPDSYAPLEESAGCTLCPPGSGTAGATGTSSLYGCVCLPSWNCTYVRRSVAVVSSESSGSVLKARIADGAEGGAVAVFNY